MTKQWYYPQQFFVNTHTGAEKWRSISGGMKMNDLISRQAVIDILAIGDGLLSRALDEMDVVGVERDKFEWGLGLIDSYIEDFKELPSVNQWIPCSERLPEESGDYLVTVARHSGELWVEVDQFDNENGSWWHYMDDVTAWMSRPEPYKGEES